MNILKKIFYPLFESDFEDLQNQASYKIEIKENLIIEKEQLLKEKEQQLNALNSEINKLKRSKTSLKKDILSKDSTINNLNTTISRFESKVENERKKKEQNWGKIVSEREEHSLEIEKLYSKIAELETTIRSKEQIIKNKQESLLSEKHAHSKEIGKLYSKTKELESIILSKEQIIKSHWNLLLSERQARSKEVDELYSEINKQNNKVQEQTHINNLLKSEISEIQKSLENKVSECSQLKSQISNLSKTQIEEDLINALKNDVQKKQETINSLELEVQKLNEQISNLCSEKDDLFIKLSNKDNELNNLELVLKKTLNDKQDIENKLHQQLDNANSTISNLKNQLNEAPSVSLINTLNHEINTLKQAIKSSNEGSAQNPSIQETQLTQPASPIIRVKPTPASTTNRTTHKRATRKPKVPYITHSTQALNISKTINFPKIENDNIYTSSHRTIDSVFNCRTNTLISANDILIQKSAEEISKIRFDLENAVRNNKPYLICPCCHQMLKISSRSIGWGNNHQDIQFFTHAVKNIHCDLKRDYDYNISTSGEEIGGLYDNSHLKNIREIAYSSLISKTSSEKGISNVKITNYIHSEELPIMKRRLADITAEYNSHNIAFEFVTLNTHTSKVHDRDIFYLINNYHVFWIFGLNSNVNYNELRRSVAKDILFTNKRNVFVFDLEAQNATKQLGELILKCNWLDEDDEWHYQIEKNGKNGELISIDKITFDAESCRPYYYNADKKYYLLHPYASMPSIPNKEDLKQNILNAWEYECNRNNAIDNILKNDGTIEAFYDGSKWGFKYDDVIFIEPTFPSEPIFSHGYAIVNNGTKFGVVNRLGEYSLLPKYDLVHILPNGHILYCENRAWHLFGVIDSIASHSPSDKIFINTISPSKNIHHLTIQKNFLAEELYFIEDKIFKKDSNKWTLWFSNDKNISDTTWDTFEITPECTIKVTVNNRYQILSLDGKLINEQKYKIIQEISSDIFIVQDFNEMWGVIDKSNNNIIPPSYSSIKFFHENYFNICSNNLWGIASLNGEIIIPPKYKSIDDFDGSTFFVSIPNPDKPWEVLNGKVDIKGAEISEVTETLTNGITVSKSFNMYGIERNNSILVPHCYNSINYWCEDKFIVKKDSFYGIISSNGNILLPFEHTSIIPIENNRCIIQKGSKSFQLDSTLHIVEDDIISLQEGFKKVKIAGKWGIKNPNDDFIVEAMYDEITTFRGRLVGIINNKLIKLNAYYPYKLNMTGFGKIVNNKKFVDVNGTLFYISPQPQFNIKDKPMSIALINWMYLAKHPIANIYNKDNIRRTKHVDKPDDFNIGDTFEATLTSFIMRKYKSSTTIKGIDVTLNDNKISHIYKPDLKKSGININDLKIGDKIQITKLDFNEELDRTVWSITT